MPITSRKLHVVELYAGTARSVEPFRNWKRATISLLVDHDRLAAQTYRFNYPNSPYLEGDLTRISAADVRWFAGGTVDILLGCPPCTGFSDTGSRNLRAFVNSHLTRFSQIAVELRPLAVAIENVPIAGETGRFDAFVRRLERAGYISTHGILNAALRGSAQGRHRLLYIGIRKDVGVAPTIPQATHGGGSYFSYRLQRIASLQDDQMGILSESPGARRVRDAMPFVDTIAGMKWIPTVGDALADLPKLGTKKARDLSHFRWQHTPNMVRRMSRVGEGGRWRGGADHYSHAYGRLHRRGLARTITTFFSNPGSGRFWHPTSDRAVSLREAARLQGFPDSFRFFNDACMGSCRLVGNALDGRLADVAYEVIRQCLE
jgi:DNA (cytosine-5)-methyltransferase 1